MITGALPVIAAAFRRRHDSAMCVDCGHRRDQHDNHGECSWCDCDRFADVAHVRLHGCRVCGLDVFADTEVMVIGSVSDVAGALRACAEPGVCSEACADVARVVEFPTRQGWRPGWYVRGSSAR